MRTTKTACFQELIPLADSLVRPGQGTDQPHHDVAKMRFYGEGSCDCRDSMALQHLEVGIDPRSEDLPNAQPELRLVYPTEQSAVSPRHFPSHVIRVRLDFSELRIPQPPTPQKIESNPNYSAASSTRLVPR